MTSETMSRKGWCPGALRPMQAKDGLLVRLRISGGVVPVATMRGLAQAGRAHGNGLFDLSARANLQMRGVREERLPYLIEVLEGLGLIDENVAAEAVRNVLVSPLAGLDGRIDAPNAAKALEAALAANKDLHALPGKFGFLIDDGSALSLGPVPADIRFDWTGGQQPFAIGIGGHANEAIFLGRCGGDDIPDIASRLAQAFLRLGSQMADPPRRMRGLIERLGAAAIAALAGLRLDPLRGRGAIAEPCPIGLLRFNDKNCFGVGAAFGRLDANMFDAAASGAEIFAAGEIRLTPWRALILPFVQPKQADAMRAYFTAHGFIADREDARLAIAACGGASACERGTTDTRADALALMPIARRFRKTGVALHVSGCAKGCARQAATPFTLIALAGRYDLVVDMTAIDAGANDAKRLDLAAVREILETMAQNAGRRSELEIQ
ncbi:MAG: precorrin-3B synthase [Pseudomonadota bacterium]|nr:precorrin-3B synthase [Pseudomonadota bacterium]